MKVRTQRQQLAVSESTLTLINKETPLTQSEPKLNSKQEEFVNTALIGKSCILIGAAGTGKTFTMKQVVNSLIQSEQAGLLVDTGHKVLRDGTPGIVGVSFTRRAVSNLRKAMPANMKQNCLTIHALLEYEPVREEVYDNETFTTKSRMSFQPQRTAYYPLPSSIHTIIIDESSMVAGEPYHLNPSSELLFNQLMRACPHNPQILFLGDIQQLPPVFGSAILGYKMLELPTVELTEVYRQALDSPIIRLAHRILSGKTIPVSEFPDWYYPDKLKIHNWKKKIKADDALATLAKFVTTAYDANLYDPSEDMILIPFNKACGTLELNKSIANHLARKYNRLTYEIIAGFNKVYFSIGDRVLYDKEEATITKIVPNPSFAGVKPQLASINLDYWGYNPKYKEENVSTNNNNNVGMSDEDIDALLVSSASIEDRVNQSSHIITVQLSVVDKEVEISVAGTINSMLLAYALTVHKAQGSEWRKVFFFTHQSHASMIQRELMYTAVTRAKEELYIICEDDAFEKGITSQRIRGNTLVEKAEYFKGKLTEYN